MILWFYYHILLVGDIKCTLTQLSDKKEAQKVPVYF